MLNKNKNKVGGKPTGVILNRKGLNWKLVVKFYEVFFRVTCCYFRLRLHKIS